MGEKYINIFSIIFTILTILSLIIFLLLLTNCANPNNPRGLTDIEEEHTEETESDGDESNGQESDSDDSNNSDNGSDNGESNGNDESDDSDEESDQESNDGEESDDQDSEDEDEDIVLDPHDDEFYQNHPEVTNGSIFVDDFWMGSRISGSESWVSVKVYNSFQRTVMLRVAIEENSEIIEFHAPVGFLITGEIPITIPAITGWHNLVISILDTSGNILYHDMTSRFININ